MRPAAVEFLVHMSLSAAVGSVNALAEDGLVAKRGIMEEKGGDTNKTEGESSGIHSAISRSEHVTSPRKAVIVHQQQHKKSITGADLNLQWRQLQNVEYLTDGGNSWIHTAVFNGKPVVVKTLKPECQDVALAINEIESELGKWGSFYFVLFPSSPAIAMEITSMICFFRVSYRSDNETKRTIQAYIQD